jgi:lipopolysaccharide export system permease protein
MKILDRYILKRFLTSYVFAVFIIVLVIMVLDFVEKNDDFLQNNAPMRAILLEYYLNLAPYWANYISPLMIFISTVFFTAQMASHTEIVAILSTGTSFRRLMFPYFIGSMLVGLFTFAMVGWVLPKANKVRVNFENNYIKEKFYFASRDYHIAVAPQTYAYISSYNNATKTGYGFTLERFDGNLLIEKLSASRIVWVDTLEKWKMHDYKIRKLGISKDLLYDGEMTKDFESTHAVHETYTLPELKKRINLLKTRGSEGIASYEIEFYQRFATPFAVIILSIMGLIVSARKARGGVGLQIAVGFILAFVYILFYILSKGFAETGDMNPVFAVWLPNIVFTSIAFVMYYTVPR